MVLTLTNFGNTIPALMAYNSMSSLRAANKKKNIPSSFIHIIKRLQDISALEKHQLTSDRVVEKLEEIFTRCLTEQVNFIGRGRSLGKK